MPGKEKIFPVYQEIWRQEGAAPASTFSRSLPPFLFSFRADFFVEVWLIYSVVLVTHTQQSDSVIHVHTCFQTFLHDSLLQDVGSRSLCCGVGPCLFHGQRHVC